MGHRKKFDMFCEEQKKSTFSQWHLKTSVLGPKGDTLRTTNLSVCKLPADMTVINFWEVKTVNTE